MCDDQTVADNERYFRQSLSRRQFGTVLGSAAIMATLPRVADALTVTGVSSKSLWLTVRPTMPTSRAAFRPMITG